MNRRQIDQDPGVLAILRQAKDKKQRRRMTPKQRQRHQDQARLKKITYRLDRGIAEMIDLLASTYRCPPAGVAGWLLAQGLRAYAAGEIEIDAVLQASDSPRWDWVIRLNGLDGLRKKVVQRLETSLAESFDDPAQRAKGQP